MKNHLSEAEVVRIWQQQLQQQRQLTDASGRIIEVVYPGRLNDSRGGDFRDALIKAAGNPQQGNIEIHARTSGWRQHGHHLDPAYNGVVLHVAWEASGRPAQTVLQNGKTIPTVILGAAPVRPAEAGKTRLPCAGAAAKLDSQALIGYLERAGEARFVVKAARFAADLAESADGQTLYRGLAGALGYSKNKLPFTDLAAAAPLTVIGELSRVIVRKDRLAGLLTAYLLGRAGLLPSQRPAGIISEAYVVRLEEVWSRLKLPATLSCRNWELFKVRPANYPVRRIVALAHLLARYPQPRWPDIFLEQLRSNATQRMPSSLCRCWEVAVPGYWSTHFDFGRRDSGLSPVLLGKERAGVILINVILPFALAWGRRLNDRALERLARDLYARYPRLATNSVEQHMLIQLGLDFRVLNSARRQQGLLHIFQTRCTQGKCAECELGGKNSW
jgi:hypothetical protein